MDRVATTLDDLLHDVLEELLKLPFNITTSRSKKDGPISELIGATLTLDNPRARLSRSETKGNAFSGLGELMWYLAKTNDLDFISYYIPRYVDEAEVVNGSNIAYGGYGPRLFNFRGISQIDNIIDLLSRKPTSRRAVIQLFDAEDILVDHKDVPCTCTLQFIVRDGKLNLLTSMRSNDAFFGLPHDIFTFTMLQEIIARTLSVDVGKYVHFVGSLHLYEGHKIKANQYLEEGFQGTTDPMPDMPIGNPWPSIETVLKLEAQLRAGTKEKISMPTIDNYWLDLIRLLEIFSHFRSGSSDETDTIRHQMSSQIYNAYIAKKIDR